MDLNFSKQMHSFCTLIESLPSTDTLLSSPAEPNSSVGSVADLRRVRSPARPIFSPGIDDSHCDRIHSSLIDDRHFDNGYVGKQPMSWKEYCVEYWLKEFQESMDWCTCCRDITEILLKATSNTIQSINLYLSSHSMKLIHLNILGSSTVNLICVTAVISNIIRTVIFGKGSLCICEKLSTCFSLRGLRRLTQVDIFSRFLDFLHVKGPSDISILSVF